MNIREKLSKTWAKVESEIADLVYIYLPKLSLGKTAIASIVAVFTFFAVTGIHSQIISVRPNMVFNPIEVDPTINVTGYRTISTGKQLVQVLLDKPGGYTSNDKLPPYSLLDDMPSWELGLLKVIREYALVNRLHFTKNQTQGLEDPDAVQAQTHLNVDNNSWMFPSNEGWLFTTGEYRKAINDFQRLEDRLLDDDPNNGNFYTRGTSLAKFVDQINSILGTQSQRLSASVNKVRLNTNSASDRNSDSAKLETQALDVSTPYGLIDDYFWEAQGTVFGAVELFKAIRVDFANVLIDKNAMPVLDQIIRELEAAQGAIYSPLVLNGSGFGMTANYSLVAGGYISRASAALTDLQRLLEKG